MAPAEVEKCWRLAEGTGNRVLALVGVPQLASYCGFGRCDDCDGPDCDRCDGSGRYVTDFLVTDYHATSGDAGPVTPWPQEPMSDDDHRRAAGCCPL